MDADPEVIKLEVRDPQEWRGVGCAGEDPDGCRSPSGLAKSISSGKGKAVSVRLGRSRRNV